MVNEEPLHGRATANSHLFAWMHHTPLCLQIKQRTYKCTSESKFTVNFEPHCHGKEFFYAGQLMP